MMGAGKGKLIGQFIGEALIMSFIAVILSVGLIYLAMPAFNNLVEKEMTFEATVAKGYQPATVKRIEQLLYISEYKRRQAPPGVKITSKNFGRDRRYPITNAFRDARDI